jgi:hypothetical protein
MDGRGVVYEAEGCVARSCEEERLRGTKQSKATSEAITIERSEHKYWTVSVPLSPRVSIRFAVSIMSLRGCLKSLFLSLRGVSRSRSEAKLRALRSNLRNEAGSDRSNLLCELNIRLLRRSADAELLAMTLFRHALMELIS